MPRPLSGQQRAQALVRRYRSEKGCKGPAYAAIRRYADRQLESVVSVPTEPGRIVDAIENGRFRIAVAQAAAHKRCVEVARDTFGEVNEIFTGEPYASLRQRARSGLDALGPAAPADKP